VISGSEWAPGPEDSEGGADLDDLDNLPTGRLLAIVGALHADFDAMVETRGRAREEIDSIIRDLEQGGQR
jgi:hypothetical protein